MKKTAKIFQLITATLLFLLLNSCDCLQTVSGTVYDNETKQVIDSVFVKKKNSEFDNAYTDKKGCFRIESIDGKPFACPPMTVVISKTGYEPVITDIENGENKNIYLKKMNKLKSDLILIAKVENVVFFNPMGMGAVKFSLEKIVKGDSVNSEFVIKFQYFKEFENLLPKEYINSKEYKEKKKKSDKIYTFKIGEKYIIGFNKNTGKDIKAYIQDTNWELDDFMKSSNNIGFCRQIKEVVGWGKYIDDPDSIIYVKKEYSKKGYLLNDNQPSIYCSVNYKYDQKGRLTEKESLCGESSSNGTTTYHYYENKTCEEEYASGYSRKSCYKFDNDGKKTESNVKYVDYLGKGDGNEITSTKYIYSNNKLIKKEERLIEYFDSTHFDYQFLGSDTTISNLTTTYTYNEYDSLLNYVVKINETGNIVEKLLIKYDSLLKIEEIKYLNGYINYKKTWNYNEQKKLIRESHFDYIYNNQKPVSSLVNNYTYKNNQLQNKEIIHYNADNKVLWKEKNIYENNLITKTVNYNNNDEISEYINYYYTYW